MSSTAERDTENHTFSLVAVYLAITVGGIIMSVSLLSPANYEFLFYQLLFISPFWVPAIFAAHALGRRKVNIAMCLLFASTEGAALAAMYWVNSR